MAESILKSVQETAKGLHKSGVMDEITMREFDALVQKWEQGQKKPNGPSLKLLNIVDEKGLEVLS